MRAWIAITALALLAASGLAAATPVDDILQAQFDAIQEATGGTAGYVTSTAQATIDGLPQTIGGGASQAGGALLGAEGTADQLAMGAVGAASEPLSLVSGAGSSAWQAADGALCTSCKLADAGALVAPTPGVAVDAQTLLTSSVQGSTDWTFRQLTHVEKGELPSADACGLADGLAQPAGQDAARWASTYDGVLAGVTKDAGGQAVHVWPPLAGPVAGALAALPGTC